MAKRRKTRTKTRTAPAERAPRAVRRVSRKRRRAVTSYTPNPRKKRKTMPKKRTARRTYRRSAVGGMGGLFNRDTFMLMGGAAAGAAVAPTLNGVVSRFTPSASPIVRIGGGLLLAWAGGKLIGRFNRTAGMGFTAAAVGSVVAGEIARRAAPAAAGVKGWVGDGADGTNYLPGFAGDGDELQLAGDDDGMEGYDPSYAEAA